MGAQLHLTRAADHCLCLCCCRLLPQLVIQTCHKRGVHAIGGMSALIPVKGNPAANEVGGCVC